MDEVRFTVEGRFVGWSGINDEGDWFVRLGNSPRRIDQPSAHAAREYLRRWARFQDER